MTTQSSAFGGGGLLEPSGNAARRGPVSQCDTGRVLWAIVLVSAHLLRRLSGRGYSSSARSNWPFATF